MQGWRREHEDTHSIELQLGSTGQAFFGVFDGHNGRAVAELVATLLHLRLAHNPSYINKLYNTALQDTFIDVDEEMRSVLSDEDKESGCAANCALITDDNRIFVANAGDCRSVLSVMGRAKELSEDHKPDLPRERKRIEAAGGKITRCELGDYRVDRCLNLSRAFGDFDKKNHPTLPPQLQKITCDPDVSEHAITVEDEFLVIACDGIWESISSQDVVNVIRLWISEGKELSDICASLCDFCLNPCSSCQNHSGKGLDNMTVIIVALLNGRTSEQWYKTIADRVKMQHGYPTPLKLPGMPFDVCRDHPPAHRWDPSDDGDDIHNEWLQYGDEHTTTGNNYTWDGQSSWDDTLHLDHSETDPQENCSEGEIHAFREEPCFFHSRL